MRSWIALFRGINVGGKNIVPMAELRTLLESLGCEEVRTYIQSGNALFGSAIRNRDNLKKRILDAVELRFNFRPALLLLLNADLIAAVENNPFPQAVNLPKTLHFYFLEPKPDTPDFAAIAKLSSNTERYELVDSVFYLYAPDGIGRSKLATAVERKLGVKATARNFNTVNRLCAMLS